MNRIEEQIQEGKRKTAKLRKQVNFATSYGYSLLEPTSFFLRIIPTDKCNLNCEYCFQKSKDSQSMSWELFEQVIEKALDLKVGLISFLGGEPMIWEPLYDAIALCSAKDILTDLTTNGTLLTEETIGKLGQAGLNNLNISVDTKDRDSVSKKNSLFDKEIVNALKDAERAYGMKPRMNAVIYKNNFEGIKLLLELSHDNALPISLGFVVPNITEDADKSIFFTRDDFGLLEEIADYILAKKRAGYPVIDPDSYFTEVVRFIEKESFWECNYPTRFGWINVTPTGRIRSCTKKMDELDVEFLSLTPAGITELKKSFEESVKECNRHCYSNCAYDSAYYKRNKLAFITDHLKGTF